MSQLEQRLADLRANIKKQLAPESAIAADFVQTMLHSGTSAHLLHLQTRSWSQHVALGEYYDEIIELVDVFAEVYQGRYGVIPEYPASYHPPSNGAVAFISEVCAYIDAARSGLPQNSHLQNIVDEMASLADSTRNKLANMSDDDADCIGRLEFGLRKARMALDAIKDRAQLAKDDSAPPVGGGQPAASSTTDDVHVAGPLEIARRKKRVEALAQKMRSLHGAVV